ESNQYLHPARVTLFPYTTLFRSPNARVLPDYFCHRNRRRAWHVDVQSLSQLARKPQSVVSARSGARNSGNRGASCSDSFAADRRSEEHTHELQSRFDLVCRLLLE